MGCKHVESKKKPEEKKEEPKKEEPKKEEVQTKAEEENKDKQEVVVEGQTGGVEPAIPIVKASKVNNDIQITIMCEGFNKFEKNYPPSTIISDIISDFSKEASKFPIKNDATWYVKDKEIKMEDTIASLIPEGEKEMSLRVEVYGLFDFVDDYWKEFSSTINFIGKPIMDNNVFKIIVFNRTQKSFRVAEPSSMDNSEIENYSQFSSICNGNDKLFISGGKNITGNLLNNFWVIDLESLAVHKHPVGMPSPKKFHSMIYVPSKYVFIVGGNDKKVFYYLYDKNEFDSWADLNEERIQPALCVVNDTFIYAFSNLRNNNDKLTFEKTNLRKKPIWEIIEPILPSDLIFTQKFFGTCYNYKNKNVIFFGGSCVTYNNKGETVKTENCFQYETISNELKSSNIPFVKSDLNEKNFLPYNNKYSLLIPDFNTFDAKIHIYNSDKNSFETFHFENQDDGDNEKVSSIDIIIEKKKDVNTVEMNNNLNVPKKKYFFNMPLGEEQSEPAGAPRNVIVSQIDNQENIQVEESNEQKNDGSSHDNHLVKPMTQTQIIPNTMKKDGGIFQSTNNQENQRHSTVERRYVNTPIGK